jgi:hypothetical protein
MLGVALRFADARAFFESSRLPILKVVGLRHKNVPSGVDRRQIDIGTRVETMHTYHHEL